MYVHPRRGVFALALICLLALWCAGSARAATEAASSAGQIRFVKRTGPEFDRFTTNPTASFADWMRTKFWRSEVFTPYFDDKTSWYGQGWVYEDSYSIYPSSPNVTAHPDWILKDAGGNRLYIPWGCSNGTCPQYAGDFGNPAYRAWWIAQVKAAVAKGYKGVWVDDVNMDMRVGNGQGQDVRPIDPRTGAPMTDVAWRDNMATFMEELRAALPSDVEILHNSIWYAVWGPRDSDPYVQRQIKAADYINLERGVNDDGLTGGTGEWSLNAVLGYVDRVHALGKGVIFDGFDASAQGREYNLAAYLETSSGRDGVGLGDMTPENWWSMYDVNLGNACGARATWQGLLRRDFAGGLVLLNEPGAPTRTVTLPRAMVNSSGASVTSVTLPARGGAVLRGSTDCTPAVPATTPAPTVPAGSTPTPTASTSTPVPAPTTTTTTTTTPAPSRTKPSRTRKPRVTISRIAKRALTAKAARIRVASRRATTRAHRAVAVRIEGRADAPPRASVVLTIRRLVGHRWQIERRVTTPVADDAWAVDAQQLPAGRYRVTAACGALAAAGSFTVGRH